MIPFSGTKSYTSVLRELPSEKPQDQSSTSNGSVTSNHQSQTPEPISSSSQNVFLIYFLLSSNTTLSSFLARFPTAIPASTLVNLYHHIKSSSNLLPLGYSELNNLIHLLGSLCPGTIPPSFDAHPLADSRCITLDLTSNEILATIYQVSEDMMEQDLILQPDSHYWILRTTVNGHLPHSTGGQCFSKLTTSDLI